MAIVFIVILMFAGNSGAAYGSLTRCGPYQLQIRKGTPENGGGSVILSRERRPVLKVPGLWYVDEVLCQDLTGDGQPELIVIDFSGGATGCCVSGQIFLLTERPTRIGEFCCNPTIEDLNRDGRKEIITSNELTLEDIPHVVYREWTIFHIGCFDGKKFVDCSKKFPDEYRKHITGTLARLRKEKDPDADFQRMGSAVILFDFMIIGREQEGWRFLKKEFPEAIIRWLQGRRAEILEQVRPPFY